MLTTHELNSVAAHLPWVVCVNRRDHRRGRSGRVFTRHPQPHLRRRPARRAPGRPGAGRRRRPAPCATRSDTATTATSTPTTSTTATTTSTTRTPTTPTTRTGRKRPSRDPDHRAVRLRVLPPGPRGVGAGRAAVRADRRVRRAAAHELHRPRAVARGVRRRRRRLRGVRSTSTSAPGSGASPRRC